MPFNTPGSPQISIGRPLAMQFDRLCQINRSAAANLKEHAGGLLLILAGGDHAHIIQSRARLARNLFQSTAGQLVFFGAGIVVLLVFALSHAL